MSDYGIDADEPENLICAFLDNAQVGSSLFAELSKHGYQIVLATTHAAVVAERDALRAENERLHAERARVRDALAEAFWDVCGLANRFQDEDFIGSVPGINGEVVGFVREYYNSDMEYFNEVIAKIEKAYGSVPPDPFALEQSHD